MIPANAFCAALSFVSHAQAVKDVRFYLLGTYLEFTGNDCLHIVATDGHRMAVVELKAPHGFASNKTRFIVPSDAVAKILSLHKKTPGALRFSAGDKGALVVEADSGSASFAVIDGTFPDWRRVLPAGEPTAGPGHWNPAYVADVAKAAAALQKGVAYPGVKVSEFVDPHIGSGKLEVAVVRTVYPEIVSARGWVMGLRP